MFVATPGNQLLALNAKTGDLLWRYKRPLPEDLVNLHPTNRGVGLLGDKIFLASADAILVALDAKTGKEAWTAKVADYRQGYYTSIMPLVADGKVMLGTSGGELGVRGFVAAYDPETGKELWRTFMVLNLVSPAARPGREAINGRPEALRSGCPRPTIRKPISPVGAPAMAAPGWATSAPAIITTPHPSWRSTARAERSRGTSNITRTIPGIGTKFRRPC